MIDIEGKPVAIQNRAEAIADYLEQKHWTNTLDKGTPEHLSTEYKIMITHVIWKSSTNNLGQILV